MAKYGKSAQKKSRRQCMNNKRGELKSGSGHTVESKKPAAAIEPSEARESGYKVLHTDQDVMTALYRPMRSC